MWKKKKSVFNKSSTNVKISRLLFYIRKILFVKLDSYQEHIKWIKINRTFWSNRIALHGRRLNLRISKKRKRNIIFIAIQWYLFIHVPYRQWKIFLYLMEFNALTILRTIKEKRNLLEGMWCWNSSIHFYSSKIFV